jgi:hypothetical protein
LFQLAIIIKRYIEISGNAIVVSIDEGWLFGRGKGL